MLKAFLLKWIGDIPYSQYFSAILDLIGKLLWPLTVFMLVILFQKDISKLIQRIRSINKGNIGVVFTTPGGEDSEKNLSKMALQAATGRSSEPLAKLAYLLSKYQYVWSAWITSQEFSHAVRFSDRYSGPGAHVRFIDEYVKELDDFEKSYGSECPTLIREPLSRLIHYLKEVLPYQAEGQELSAPAFSVSKYLGLFGSAISAAISLSKGNDGSSTDNTS